MPEEIQPKSGSSAALMWKVGAVAVLGSLLAQMDATVVNVSLSNLASSLQSNISTIQWVISGYLLALALTLPLNGWAVHRIGPKALYLWCFSAFTVCSCLCGLAWSAPSLIAFRVAQGMSGGLMAPLAQMVMARVAGKNIARVFGYVAMPVMLGPILGPVLAGAILQHASWRWIFFINLPLGLLGVILAAAFLPNERPSAGSKRFDLPGFLLLSPALVSFLYGADRFTQGVGRAALILALLLFAGFFLVATRKKNEAIVDLQLFRSRVFSVAATTQFLVNGIAFGGQMLIPLYLIRACGKSPGATGWLLAPLGAGMLFTFFWVGTLTERFGIRKLAAAGALIALLGTLPLVYMAAHGLSVAWLACALVLRGAGLTAAGVPSISGAYASVRKEELATATTSMNIVQRLGGPACTTACATFLGWKMGAAHSGEVASAAFVASFLLLCGLHALLVIATLRLPRAVPAPGR